jgi:hypothetical protein
VEDAIKKRLLKLTERGSTSAMRLLADLYRNGYYGVTMDADKADHWDKQYAAAEPLTRFYLHDLEGSL